MKRIKESLKDQGILFSNHYIGDRLSEDDEVYLFDKLIDKLDISAMMNSYSSEGGSMFSPRDQLAVITYAFHKGITSSTKIAELVLQSLPFIYLAGGHIIKRRTICDFRIKHRETISKIFGSSINIATEIGIVNNDNLFAIDGSKIEANASFSKTRRKKEWEERQEKIIDHVEKFLQEWEEQDRLEEDLEDKKKEEFDRVKEKLDKIKDGSRKKKIESKKNENIKKDKCDSQNSQPDNKNKAESTEKKKGNKKESSAIYKKNKITVIEVEDAGKFLDEHEDIDSLLDEYESADDDMLLSLTDPDCRIMKSDSTTKECYNVQIISNNQVIVAINVTQEENDQHQLIPMIEQLKKNLGLDNENIIFAGDAGYNMGKNLAYIDQHENIDAYISMFDRSGENNPDTNKFYKENFEYDEDDDSWKCPEGKQLEFKNESIRDNKKHTSYGCELKECVFCPLRDSCITTKADIKRGYRTIEDDGYLIYRKEMRTKMQQEDSKKIYSKRSGSVEPVFGQIKNNRNFTRFRLTGLEKVQIETTIMAIAHNLGKAMRYIIKKRNPVRECTI